MGMNHYIIFSNFSSFFTRCIDLKSSAAKTPAADGQVHTNQSQEKI